MAPVSPRAGRRDRGQLMLVGALVLAISIVAIVFVLNSGIYAHNLASRTDASADDALQFQEEVRATSGRTIREAIEVHGDQLSDQRSFIDDEFEVVVDQLTRYESTESVIVTAERTGPTTDGTVVRQTADSDFRDTSGNAGWDLVAGVDRIRAFRLNVVRSDLVDANVGGLTGVFTIELSAGGDTWTVRIYRDATAGETRLATVSPGGTTYGPCVDASGSRTVIDVTGAQVGGSHCRALEFFSTLPDDLDLTETVTVSYSNTYDAGTSTPLVTGRYRLVVDEPETNVDGARFASEPDADEPTAEKAVYAIEMDLFYQSPDLTYRTEGLRVAPGEPDD